MHKHRNYVKALKGPFKPFTSLQTQAGINYAVKCASEKQKIKNKKSIFNVQADEEIDQHAILLTRKVHPGTVPPAFQHLGTFTRLNMIDDKAHDDSYDVRRHKLMNDLTFAGIAFVNVTKENAKIPGSISMFASQHGGTTTVRAVNVEHDREKRFMPGTVVRWTLPKNPNIDITRSEGWLEPPVHWSMPSCAKAVFAELEAVTPENLLEDVFVQYKMDIIPNSDLKEILLMFQSKVENDDDDELKMIKRVLNAYMTLSSRIIGKVVSDDGQGSVGVRLD